MKIYKLKILNFIRNNYFLKRIKLNLEKFSGKYSEIGFINNQSTLKKLSFRLWIFHYKLIEQLQLMHSFEIVNNNR